MSVPLILSELDLSNLRVRVDEIDDELGVDPRVLLVRSSVLGFTMALICPQDVNKARISFPVSKLLLKPKKNEELAGKEGAEERRRSRKRRVMESVHKCLKSRMDSGASNRRASVSFSPSLSRPVSLSVVFKQRCGDFPRSVRCHRSKWTQSI